jgi:hypothetical protein
LTLTATANASRKALPKDFWRIIQLIEQEMTNTDRCISANPKRFLKNPLRGRIPIPESSKLLFLSTDDNSDVAVES